MTSEIKVGEHDMLSWVVLRRLSSDWQLKAPWATWNCGSWRVTVQIERRFDRR